MAIKMYPALVKQLQGSSGVGPFFDVRAWPAHYLSDVKRRIEAHRLNVYMRLQVIYIIVKNVDLSAAR